MREKRVSASKPVASKVPAWHRSRNLVSDTELNTHCNYQLGESVITLSLFFFFFFEEFTVFENCFLKSHYFISSFYIYKEEVKDISFTEDLKFETGPCNVGEAGSKLPLYLLACSQRGQCFANSWL